LTDLVQIVAVVVAVGLLGVVIDLVRRRLLVEEYALIWLVGAASMLLLSVFREILHTLARWLDIHYPPSLLLLLLVLFVFLGLLGVSVIMSSQRAQIRRLFEDIAILSARLRELDARQRTASPDEPRESA
jgi:hypothetical protein